MAGGRAYEQLLPETKRHNGFRELQMLCPNAKPSGQADWFSEPVTEIRCTHDIQCKIRQYGSSCIRTHIPHQTLYFTFSFYNYPLTLGTCSNLLTFCAELLCWKTTEKSYSVPFKSLFVSNICPQNLGEKIIIPAALYLCFIWCLFNWVTDIFFLNILPSFFFMHFPVPPCSYYFPFFILLKFKLRFYLFYDCLFIFVHTFLFPPYYFIML